MWRPSLWNCALGPKSRGGKPTRPPVVAHPPRVRVAIAIGAHGGGGGRGEPGAGAEAGEDRKNYYIHESVGIATGLLMAACHEAGLATLVHTPNPMNFLNGICGRPATEKPFLILVAGHPAEGAMVPKHALKKKPLSDIADFL